MTQDSTIPGAAYTEAVTDVRWLSDDEQRAWRAFLAGSQLLMHQLGRELQHEHGLTHNDYEILVNLSEAPGRRMRMSDLAERCLLSKSRLSHQITRMEQAGLVTRETCPSDRRGSFAVLTDEGMRRLEKAAPDHVESVRRHFIDRLSGDELTTLHEVMHRTAEPLRNPQNDSSCH
jgi:DNA-binding MarR family transcriptional regulator